MNPNKFSSLLDQQGYILLDGGLATELEQLGYDLRHPLWSAKLLVENPKVIKEVHKSYARAGSNCLLSASYQLSFPGGNKVGLSKKEIKDLLINSVQLIRSALDELEASATNKHIVAASLGPYGASLGNGSEYTGHYDVTLDYLRDFHIRRLEVMSNSNCDVVAFETIPNIYEAEILRRTIEEFPSELFWISFSCRNGEQISDGSSLEQVAKFFDDCPNIVAVGVNCTAPQYITPLIHLLKKGAPHKPSIVYPNSGETYDTKNRCWIGEQSAGDFGSQSMEWFKAGAQFLGGCCQTGPEHIKMIRMNLEQKMRKDKDNR